ncbi:hypothetical protein KUCAC02_017965 [Chaenocephalus aceratus]|uniref:Uncharacterized protein n=1 Tax=Chaenocephalus aceratus TaxID=36190 RepID=A0ACB9W7R7_CHAAC|nr:hypothetical protein KUCAC02_017965 [Chaenocephalus aceratus]
MVDQFTVQSKKCHQKDTEGCWIRFDLDQLFGEDHYKANILKQRDCRSPPQCHSYHRGSIASVCSHWHPDADAHQATHLHEDIKEFRKFENEKKKSKWAEADNPLFQTATTTVSNPTFTGE